jgi:hypothetical protein
MTTPYAITPFINVLVRVKKKDAEPGYEVWSEPSALKVLQRDTVINYQIVETYGEDIVFSGLQVTPPDLNQISAPAISPSGKLLTVSDANTSCCNLSLFLEFTNLSTKEVFSHDPQVQNETSD